MHVLFSFIKNVIYANENIIKDSKEIQQAIGNPEAVSMTRQ